MNEEVLQNIYNELVSKKLTGSDYETWKKNFSRSGEIQKNVHTYLSENNLTKSDLSQWKSNLGVKKKEVSEPTSVQKPLESNTQTPKQNTSLDTEEPAQAQASDGLGGPPKMKEFTGFTQEEQQKMKSPQKPATTLPTQQQIQSNAGKTRTQMIRNLSDLAVSKKPLDEQSRYYSSEYINAVNNKNEDRESDIKNKRLELNKKIEEQKEQEERNKRIANLDQLKYNKTLYDNFLNSHKDSDIDRQEAAQEIDDEFKRQGVLNTLKDFGKNAWNTIVDVNATGLSFGNTDKGPDFLRFETDPTKEYIDKANKEYEEKLRLTEEARKTDPSIELLKYDPKQIKQRAYEIAVQSKLDGKRQSRIDEFMRNHQDDADLSTLKKYTERDYQTISKEDKKLLELNKVSNSMYQMSNQNLIGIVDKINDLDSKKQPIPQDLIDQLKTEKQNNDYLRDAYLKANDDYNKKHEKLGSFSENLDILNRDYSFGATNLAALAKYGGETIKSLLGSMDYMSQFFPKTKEFQATNDWIGGKIEQTNQRLNEIEGAVEKPIESKDISSASDFGRWLVNQAIIPTAGFMSKASIGPAGVGLVTVESTGGAYEEMIDRMKADPNIQYSQAQLIANPLLKGTIDGALLLFNAAQLKNAQRLIKSAGNVEKDLIAESVLKEITSKQLHGAAVMNGLTVAKNAVDKYSGVDPERNLLEGTGESTAISVVTVGMLDTAPRIAVNIVSEFSLDNSALKASKKVNDLTLRLDQKGLSDEHREIISKQLEKAKKDMHKIVKSQAKDISSLSDSQYKEVIRLNNTRANIFEKAKSIKMDQNISPEMKKQLFEGLKEELDDTNNRRRELLLNGPKAELERMDPIVSDALRAKAEAQLIKENNPNGDKDVTIPQADIDKRAMALHNEKIFEAKQAEEVSDIDANKSDIEKRRQEELKSEERRTAESIHEVEFEDGNGDIRKSQVIFYKDGSGKIIQYDVDGERLPGETKINKELRGITKDNPEEIVNRSLGENAKTISSQTENIDNAIVNKINAKYDAELKALEQKPIEEKSVPLHETLTALEGLGKREKLRAIDSNLDSIIKELGLKTENC